MVFSLLVFRRFSPGHLWCVDILQYVLLSRHLGYVKNVSMVNYYVIYALVSCSYIWCIFHCRLVISSILRSVASSVYVGCVYRLCCMWNVCLGILRFTLEVGNSLTGINFSISVIIIVVFGWCGVYRFSQQTPNDLIAAGIIIKGLTSKFFSFLICGDSFGQILTITFNKLTYSCIIDGWIKRL